MKDLTLNQISFSLESEKPFFYTKLGIQQLNIKNVAMRRVVLGSNFERAGGGASPVMMPLMKNTFEQLTEKRFSEIS